MIYLSGAVNAKFKHPRVGFMLNPNMGNYPPIGRLWAADNGAFSAEDGGKARPVDADRWAIWLHRVLSEASDTCLFVVAPDVPFDMEGTLAQFEQYARRARAFSRPVAFVTQDGMGVEDVPWNDADALMVGGSTTWKTSTESAALVQEAKERRKWVHMGRVNSYRRFRQAAAMGCDSADGTFLKYGPDTNWPRLLEWFRKLDEGARR